MPLDIDEFLTLFNDRRVYRLENLLEIVRGAAEQQDSAALLGLYRILWTRGHTSSLSKIFEDLVHAGHYQLAREMLQSGFLEYLSRAYLEVWMQSRKGLDLELDLFLQEVWTWAEQGRQELRKAWRQPGKKPHESDKVSKP